MLGVGPLNAAHVPYARALLLLKERVIADRMPLLSLLQASPLQLQAAHLSFQEFFTCCAICARHHEQDGASIEQSTPRAGRRIDRTVSARAT